MKLNRTYAVRIAPALLLSATLAVPLALARTEDPPKAPEVSAAEKARQRAVLDQTFQSLEEELKAVLVDYSKEVQAASAKKLPREQWPKTPANDFYPRFEVLALQGQPDSLRWCIGVMPSIDLPMDMRNSKRDALYKHYIATNIDSKFTGDIIGYIATEGTPTGLGVDRVVPFLDQIASSTKSDDVRKQALWTKSQLYLKSDKPEHGPLAIASFKTIGIVFPTSSEAAQAKGIVFQLEHLQVGMTAPDVSTSDVDGNAFKLSDSRGKVTMVVFFGFGHRATPYLLPQLKELAKHFEGKPFTIVGVTNDASKEDFKKSVADAGIDWKIAWQGGPAGPWLEEWGIARLPSLYVLDQRGVIRFKDIELPAIKVGVEQLLTGTDPKQDNAKKDASK